MHPNKNCLDFYAAISRYIYTFADEEYPAVEGESFSVQCDIQEGSEVFVYEFRIREFYTDPGSSDYAYVIDVYRDRHFVFSSLKK
nr:MAG TPA: hypothetical protein [Caudoviricetes sp.]